MFQGMERYERSKWWPSKWLREVLTGNVPMKDAPDSVQSWARLSIHEGAMAVMNAGGIEKRREMLSRIPAPIRPFVEARVRELWTP